jgi:hypothetical protein
MIPKRLIVASAAILLLGPSVYAHRLDEYLQATLISVEKDRVQAEMRLTPGVAVSSFVLMSIDTNADGALSEAERRVYAEQVLRDLSLTMDGHPLRPRLISVEFPALEEMKEGLGEIRIQFETDVPRGGSDRRLIFENHHQSRIAAYLVNCLAPQDPNIRVIAQKRNEQQSFYQLDYAQDNASPAALPVRWWQGPAAWLWAVALLMLVRLVVLLRRQSRGRSDLAFR